MLREHASEWFDLDPKHESPYMLLVAPVRDGAPHRRRPGDAATSCGIDPDLRHRVNVVRSDVPAVTHVDYSARLQTVDAERNPRFHAADRGLPPQTGCPVLVNTSFNVRGEPIVCTPEDAYRCFLATDMDALVLEDFVVHKRDLPQVGPAIVSREEHLAQFSLD